MLASSPIIKTTAKTALSQHWLSAFAVSTVLVLAFFVGIITSSIVSIFGGLVGYFLFSFVFFTFAFSPMLLGAVCWFRRLLWGQNDSVLLIFKYFVNYNEYKRVLHLVCLLIVKLIGAALILFFPCIVVGVLSSEWFYNLFNLSLPVWTSSLWTLNSFLAIFGFIILVFFALKYYLCIFLFVSNDSMHPAEAINMSTIISKRTGPDFFGLVISFTGWIILSFLVLPLIFILPYFITSYNVHCRYAITAYNHDVDRFNSNSTPSFSTDEI